MSTTTNHTSHTTGTPGVAADHIGVAELRRLLRADPATRILDVRSGGEFDSCHIEGAYNVPLDTLAEHVDDLAGVDHPVVLVCRSGARAGQAHTKLATAGKQRLHLLDGGMDAWEAAGGNVVRGDRRVWTMDRQVRFAAGSIALAALAASVAVPKAKWLAGGVAFGLSFSALTDTCAMGNLLARLPFNRSDKCDIERVLDDLRRAA